MKLNSLLTFALGLFACCLAASCGGGGGGGESVLPLTDRLLVVRDTGIFELNLQTGSEQPLIPDLPNALAADPAISPDGGQIAFSALLQGVAQQGQPADFGSDVYVANRDGSNQRLAFQHRQRGEQVRAPAWLSPGKLMFSVQRFEQTGFVAEMHLLDLASSADSVLINGAIQATASPDAMQIAYVMTDQNNQQSLWIANADGSGPRDLAGTAQGLGTIISPRFSPDGRMIAFGAAESTVPAARIGPTTQFVSRLAGVVRDEARAAMFYDGIPMDIWTVDVQTGEAKKLSDLNCDQPSLAYSNDGLRLFVLDARALFAVDSKTGKERSVAPGTFHGQLDWLAASSPQ